jgi:hypothetical protein
MISRTRRIRNQAEKIKFQTKTRTGGDPLTRCRELVIQDDQICFSCVFLENDLSDPENFYISKIPNPSSLESQIALPRTNHNTVII